MKYHRSQKHRGECKHRYQSQRQVGAVRRSGASQGGHPTEREFRILCFELVRETLSVENELR